MIDERFSKYNRHIIAVCLSVAILAVFWQAVGHEFVFDDEPYVVENQRLQSGLTLSAVKWCFTSTHVANWHPLTWLSHLLDFRFYGLNPSGHHVTNLLFHIANALLLLLVLKRMTGSLWRSAFVAALFAVHPLHVESVAWVAERKDVLSTFFWLLTMWAYVRYVERPRPRRYLLVTLALGLGLMAKPMLVSVPIVLLLLDYWPLGRLSLGDAEKRNRTWAGWKLVWEKVPLFALSAASGVITYLAQQKGGAVIEFERFPLGIRIANALVSYVRYIEKMFWPEGLAAFYPHPLDSLPVWQVAGACLLLAGISVVVIRAARRRPYLGVGWLWYLITLVPVIGVVQVGEQAMADRYTYVPLIGLFVIIAWGAPDLLRRSQRENGRVADTATSRRISVSPAASFLQSTILPILAGAVIAALMVCTWLQVGYWHSDMTLFQRAVRVTDRNVLAHNNLGIALAEEGKLEQAVDHYSEALAINPNYVDAHYNLGNAQVEQGKIDEAAQHYEEALRLKPDYQKASLGLANIVAKRGGTKEAVGHYLKILQSNPGDADVHYNLGVMMTKQGRTEEAISYYSKALAINPRHAKAHNNLGLSLAEHGNLDEAITHYSAALQIKPDYPQAHHNLGKALAEKGKLDDAVKHLAAAVRIKPDYSEAHNNLGVVLAQQNRIDEAMTHFSKAVRLKPDYVDAHRNLAMALYFSGKYAEAWKEVHACRGLGAQLPPGFTEALSEKMPDPGR